MTKTHLPPYLWPFVKIHKGIDGVFPLNSKSLLGFNLKPLWTWWYMMHVDWPSFYLKAFFYFGIIWAIVGFYCHLPKRYSVKIQSTLLFHVIYWILEAEQNLQTPWKFQFWIGFRFITLAFAYIQLNVYASKFFMAILLLVHAIISMV